MVYAIDITQNFAPAKISNFGNLLNIILPTLILGAALIFLVMILYGAFTYITAGDNPKNIQKAQHIFIFAGIGLLFVVLSFTAVKLISYFLGVDLQGIL
jgi:hypothetical protein